MEQVNIFPGEDNFQELLKYYAIAKKHLIYSENVSQRTSIGVVNELRNALDHMIRAFASKDHKEFDKAIRHLKRAAYDSCELISIEFSLKIDEKLKNYDFEIVSQVLPDYYSAIYPRLIIIQQEIAREREHNDEIFNQGNADALETYTNLYTELIDIDLKISHAILGMDKAQRTLKRQQGKINRKNILINIAVGIISALITTIILYYSPFGKNNEPVNQSPTEIRLEKNK
jgi:hypothetical protein